MSFQLLRHESHSKPEIKSSIPDRFVTYTPSRKFGTNFTAFEVVTKTE